MARRARARRRLDPEIRRQELIEAAERLLRRRGPDVRVEDVVREAAAAKGTFYVYFPTWEDLLDVLRDRTLRAFDAAYPVPAGRGADLDWLRLVERLAVAFVDGVVAMGGLHTVLFHTDFAQRRPLPDDDSPIGRLIAIVRAGREAGAFADVDSILVGRLLFAVIHETADAVVAGADRKRALAAMRRVLRKTLEPDVR
jgi:AcrR family transcriptional regulator